MNNLLQHYKNRDPLITVSKVRDFFYKNNFIIKEIANEQNECGTYYCRLHLYKNDIFILGTNGKGVTKEYSLASGYGELYERFCNKFPLLQSDIGFYKLNELNLLNNKDNRSVSEICEEYPILNNWIHCYFKNNYELFSQYYYKMTNNNPQKDKFISFDDEINIKPLFLDSRLIMRMSRTKGMVAGNTIEEALNQGISELYECWGYENFYLNPPEHFYILSDKVLEKLSVWKNICEIRELGYKIYVIDLGYTYNCPVIATFVVNQNSFNINVNFGSFPVIDVAIERTITEIYQGKDSLNNSFFGEVQIPYKTTSPAVALNSNANEFNYLSFDETIFNNFIEVDKCSNTFLNSDKNYSNKELNNYFKKLNKEHNFKMYYKNNSLITNMTALHIVCLDMQQWKQLGNMHLNINNITRQKNLQELLAMYNILPTILYKNIDEIINELTTFNRIVSSNLNRLGAFMGNLSGDDIFSFYSSFSITSLFSMLNLTPPNNNLFDMPIAFEDKIYTPLILKYRFIIQYKNMKYTDEEIKQFYSIFNSPLELTQEDLDNIYNNEYLLKKIFIEPLRKYYNSQDYEEVLRLMYNTSVEPLHENAMEEI